MSKKVIITIVTILILLSIGGYVYYSRFTKQTVPSKASEGADPQESQFAESVATYTDASGFSFQYPSSFKIVPATELSSTEFANITLSSEQTAGTITLTISDSPYKTTNDWVSKDAQLNTNAKAQAVHFGSLTGNELITANIYKSAAVDQGVLFLLQTDGNSDSLLRVYRKILQTFSFVPSTQPTEAATSSTTDTTSSDIIFEGEEEIE